MEDGARAWQVQASDQLARAADYQPLIVRYQDGAPVRLRRRGARERRRRGPVQHGLLQQRPGRAARRSAGSPTPTSSRRWTRSRRRCPRCEAFLPAGVEPADRQRSLAEHPRARCTTPSGRCSSPSLLVILVVLLFLASFRRRDHPGRRRARRARRQLRGDVPVGLLAQQPLADGAHRRDRPRRGRRDRGAREHLAPRRDGEAAVRGGASSAPARSGATLLSMNLALVAVFVSILFMGGIVERLFREFSITLVAAIVISLFVSLTLTPMLCARWLGPSTERAAQPVAAGERPRVQAAAARLRPDPRVGPAQRAARRLPAARRHRAQRAPVHRRRPRASCRSRTPGRSAGSSAATTARRSR